MVKDLKPESVSSSSGARIFRLPLEVFSGYYAYCHLVIVGGKNVLVDVGSGFGDSHKDLAKGLELLQSEYGVNVSWQDIDVIVITHGHIDHFGGLGLVKVAAPQAQVAIHELAKPVLVNYDERLLLSRQRLSVFLERAGVPDDRRKHLLDLHMLGKRAFQPQPVDIVLTDEYQLLDELLVIHVPGHEPGLIMVQVGDVMLTSDHLLPDTSVAIAPESITPFTGIAHYLDSVRKAASIDGIALALGGHEHSMLDYYDVVERTLQSSLQKVEHVRELCARPATIYDLAQQIYGDLDGYGELLKIEQTGARIEYLNQRGLVLVDNLDALEQDGALPLTYRAAK